MQKELKMVHIKGKEGQTNEGGKEVVGVIFEWCLSGTKYRWSYHYIKSVLDLISVQKPL